MWADGRVVLGEVIPIGIVAIVGVVFLGVLAVILAVGIVVVVAGDVAFGALRLTRAGRSVEGKRGESREGKGRIVGGAGGDEGCGEGEDSIGAERCAERVGSGYDFDGGALL